MSVILRYAGYLDKGQEDEAGDVDTHPDPGCGQDDLLVFYKQCHHNGLGTLSSAGRIDQVPFLLKLNLAN
jgi:hypothetical protein